MTCPNAERSWSESNGPFRREYKKIWKASSYPMMALSYKLSTGSSRESKFWRSGKQTRQVVLDYGCRLVVTGKLTGDPQRTRLFGPRENICPGLPPEA
jgi:hypothetical protein